MNSNELPHVPLMYDPAKRVRINKNTLSRILTSDVYNKGYAIISAWRQYRPDDKTPIPESENLSNTIELCNIIADAGYGFTRLWGGYAEQINDKDYQFRLKVVRLLLSIRPLLKVKRYQKIIAMVKGEYPYPVEDDKNIGYYPPVLEPSFIISTLTREKEQEAEQLFRLCSNISQKYNQAAFVFWVGSNKVVVDGARKVSGMYDKYGKQYEPKPLGTPRANKMQYPYFTLLVCPKRMECADRRYSYMPPKDNTKLVAEVIDPRAVSPFSRQLENNINMLLLKEHPHIMDSYFTAIKNPPKRVRWSGKGKKANKIVN